jgi:hypothetical protein
VGRSLTALSLEQQCLQRSWLVEDSRAGAFRAGPAWPHFAALYLPFHQFLSYQLGVLTGNSILEAIAVFAPTIKRFKKNEN